MNDIDLKDKSENKDSILDEALKRFSEVKDYWEPIHKAYIDDYLFYMGQQWTDKEKADRNKANLSTLVYNTLPSKVKYIVNNARANTPAIKVHPVNDGANKDTAMVFDGLIKAFDRLNGSKQAYIKALECAAIGGIGAWTTGIEDDEGIYNIANERVLDPTTIYYDPSAKKQDFSDARYCFVVSQLSRDEFSELYGTEEDSTPNSQWQDHSEWSNDEMVQICEYWTKDDGVVTQYILTKDRILSSTNDNGKSYKGKFIPVFLLTGDEQCINGKREYKGIVRDVRDIQYVLNLSKSKMADYIYKSSNEEWLVEAEMIANTKQMWIGDRINNYQVKVYDATAAGRPEKIAPTPPPVGFIEAGKEADADIRANIGIRDPLQDVPSSQSGKAIALQISQGNIGTFQFMDNLNELIKYNGKVILDLIQKYLTDPQIREIIGIDDQVNSVNLNEQFIENGISKIHDLSVGKYGVTVTAGASYESQRAETLDKLIELSTKNPKINEIGPDIIVGMMDFVGADELAARLKATIPQNILQASNPTNGIKPEQQVAMLQAQLQEMQAQMAQAQQQAQMAQQELQVLQSGAQQKINEIQTKAQVDAQILQATQAHEMQMAQMQMEHQARIEAMKAQIGLQSKSMDLDSKEHLEGSKALLQANMQKSQFEHEAKLKNLEIDGQMEVAQFNADSAISKIREQTHSDVFIENMKAMIAEDSLAKTGEDLSY